MSEKKHIKETKIKKSKLEDQEDLESMPEEEADNKNQKTFTPSSEKQTELQPDEVLAELSDIETSDGVDRIANLEGELVEANDKLSRALAESENVRRRSLREKEEFGKRANSNFAKEILPVADNIQRALENVDDSMCHENEAYRNFVEGIKIIEKTMDAALKRQGIKIIEAEGKKFDPRVHEAMFEYDDLDQPAGSVGQVLEIGYTINDLLLRPAKVGVTKGGPEELRESSENKPNEPTPVTSEAYEDESNEPGSRLDEEL